MPATPKLADTGTPDTTAGIPITMTQVDDGAGVGQRQVVSIASPSVGGRYVEPTVAGALPVDGSAVVQPVSGVVAVSNLLATQPVSAVALPLPAGASTEATLALIKAKTDNLDVLLSTRTKPADSQTVTGTVALGAGAAVVGTVKVGDGTNTVAVKVSAAAVAADPALVVTMSAASASIPVTQAGPFAIKDTVNGSILGGAKGVQQSVGLQTQDMKDSGRTYVCITVNRAAGIAAEALATMTINRGETVTTGTTYTVTAGKTLRLQTFKLSVRASAATIVSARAFLRTAASALAITSPLIAILEAGSNAAVIEDVNTEDIDFPDGVEIAATHQIGISHLESTATGTVTFTLIGYEY